MFAIKHKQTAEPNISSAEVLPFAEVVVSKRTFKDKTRTKKNNTPPIINQRTALRGEEEKDEPAEYITGVRSAYCHSALQLYHSEACKHRCSGSAKHDRA